MTPSPDNPAEPSANPTPPPIHAEKKALRARIVAALRAQDAATRQAQSADLCARILASDFYRAARAVMLFIPMPEEVDLLPIARDCLASGRRVLAPRIAWESRSLEPACISDLDQDLRPGRMGIREPGPACPGISPEQIDLVLVPGVAFDSRAQRLGRGGGFYDRFLSRREIRAQRVGVAFDLQIVDRIPREPHDAVLDAVVTPTRVIVPHGPPMPSGG